ncbi:peptide deformylase [Acidithiobacillus sp. 'AMD consortium']|jgi:peptide deformylase|uniref:Peptide deformylase n=2 Tax=Acidithiobacillus ferridurans TaxID=1232575 RepID=A0A2Z6IJ64_ACIFI|nr:MULTISPECIES: peptide deformylase [Acidithiobacillus]MBU2715921.1 peptide deformylase [Acidithiobacillus ferridurans]MBU2723644.1 peptide deformylase [Acidithiobacillus ferridurans]MBU2728274.1 peptide deformylase [Acidithiobacillus ferridurans]MBU2733813.1 peptide deformylase [Acidithiobacillus ferridurans]QFG77633.1 peptide deformylase [Acidithiobacillus sp. 'AMD consortium']
MAVLPILTYPDSRLQRKADPVSVFDDDLRRFIDDLTETMYAGPGGVGIAAPQVDRAQRIVIVDVRPKLGDDCHGPMVLINPELAAWEGMAVGREGCMSVPDFTGNVIRAERIQLQAQDVLGRERSYECEGFEARAVQHEMDHLDGLLFLDRLVSRKVDLFRRKNYRK